MTYAFFLLTLHYIALIISNSGLQRLYTLRLMTVLVYFGRPAAIYLLSRSGVCAACNRAIAVTLCHPKLVSGRRKSPCSDLCRVIYKNINYCRQTGLQLISWLTPVLVSRLHLCRSWWNRNTKTCRSRPRFTLARFAL